MRVLIVEDDPAVAAGLADGLSGASFELQHALTGRAGLEAVATFDPELIVLDLGLPDMDGVDVCREVRRTSDVPIIVVSARGDEADRVIALELGADDYLVKPFGMRELLARIRAVTRRTAATAAATAAGPGTGPGSSSSSTGNGVDVADAPRALGRLTLDERSRRVTLDGEAVHLTATEFDLLAHLSSDPGAVMRRGDILRDVWQTEWYGATKTLDAHVAAIRRKLGDPAWIESVRGVGFRFEIVA